MTCRACAHENPASNAFCGGCGAPLVVVCPKCSEPNPPGNSFCGKCGQRVAPDPAAALEPEVGERRQLTVLFCDLVGSTDLSTRLDPEDYREALRAYHTRADAVIARYGGAVAQHLGDGLLVYFGWPQTYDDSAERAVRAGLELVEATATVRAGGAALATRVGLHTGAAVVSDVGAGTRRETLALGDTPNVAARVQSAAQPGQVVLTAATHRLVAGLFIVEELGRHPLKGVPQPVELYRVVQPSGVRGRLGAAAAHGFTPFVNRSEERALLRNRFERACEGEGQVVLLTGEAGIGKSRLVQVLREELADTPHTWLETGGAAHFANTPFYPLTELLRERRPWEDDSPAARAEGLSGSLRRAGVDPEEALALVAPLMDIPVPEGCRPVVAAPEVARKRLLATLAAWLFGTARLQPLVVLIEDLHWVDPSSLELLHMLVNQGTTAPLLLLLTARPQFQVPWPLRAHYTQLTLSHLAKRHVRDMVLGVAAQAHLLAEVIDAVAVRTDGVPLFVEELTKAVLEGGAAVAAREIPSTLADSLMARLDRLGPAAKEVAQVGAVCGRQFSFVLIHAVHPVGEAELEAGLRKLVDAELLHVRGLAPDATYTFRHALVQEAAYESLLKSRRRTLHSRVAETLVQHFAAAAAEHPELLAHHHEAAGQIEPAVAGWQLAGEQALQRGAIREAESYLQRGLRAVATQPQGPARDRVEFHLLLALAKVAHVTRGYGADETGVVLRRVREVGQRVAEPAELAMMLIAEFWFALMRDGSVAAQPIADELLHAAQQARLPFGLGWAHFAQAATRFYAGDFAGARECSRQACQSFQEASQHPAGFDPTILAVGFAAYAAWHLGLGDEARQLGRDAVARAEASGRATDRASAYQLVSVLYGHMLGEPDAALDAVDRVLVACAEEPSPGAAATATVMRGWILLEQGQAEAGLAQITTGVEALASTGLRLGALPMALGILADAYVATGQLDQAQRVLDDSDDMSRTGNFRANTLRRRADLMATEGADAAAVEGVYRDALACARQQGSRAFELRTALSYARWLRSRRRARDAQMLLAPLYTNLKAHFESSDLHQVGILLEELTEAEWTVPEARTAERSSDA